MIKMVIADDEVLTLDMLACIIDWAKLGIEIVGKATNGKEALDIIRLENPDIFLTDIQMPQMDGIELLKVLAQSHPHLIVIILSAYGEFHYAQDAIRYGASGFLVKPIDEHELEEMITYRLQSYQENLTATQEASFRKLLATRNGTPALLQAMESKGISAYYKFRVFVIHANPVSDHDQTLIQSQFRSHSDRTIAAIQQFMSKQSVRGYVFENQDEEWICIAEQPGLLGSQIVDMLLSELQFNIVVGVSALKASLNDLSEAYSEALDCLRYRFLFSSEHVFEYDQLMPFASKDSNAHHEVYVRLQALMDELLTAPIGFMDWRGQIIESIKKYKTLEALLDYLEASLQQLAQENEQSPSYGNDLIGKAQDYIQAHYNKQISLESICSHIAVSKNYFSSLFKKVTGMNVWDYLTIVRMEHAKKLLLNTSMKNYEISHQIGYENPSYFTKMFKKTTGMLPQEFRIRDTEGGNHNIESERP